MPYAILGGHSEFTLSKQTAQLAAGLNVRIATWNDSEETLRIDLKKFRETPLEKLPAGLREVGSQLGARRLSLLRDELVLVNDLCRYYELLEQDRYAWAEKASNRYEELKEKVTEDLIKIGYVRGLIPGGIHTCITPQMIMHHPAVFAAKNLAAALQFVTFNDRRGALEVRAEAIASEIDAIRTKSLSIA